MAWDNLSDEEKAILAKSGTQDAGPSSYATLTPEQLSEIEKETKLSKEFDNPAAAAALALARGASGGLSDLALTETGAMSPEALKQYKEKNPQTSFAGEIGGFTAGIVGPGKLLSPVGKLATVGEAAGAAASKKLTSETAKRIVAPIVSEAVTGAGLGAGQYASEMALENQKFSAEALLSHVGPGALIGGGFGAALGLGSATIPVIKNVGKITGVTQRLEDAGEYLTSRTRAAQEWVGLSPSAMAKLDEGAPAGHRFSDKLVDYVEKNLVSADKKIGQTAADVNAKVIANAGKEIGDYINILDKEVTANPEILDNLNPRARLQAIIDRTRTELSKSGSQNYGLLRQLKNVEKDLTARFNTITEKSMDVIAQAAGLSKGPTTGILKELNDLRKSEAKFVWAPKNAPGAQAQNWRAQLAKEFSSEIRNIVDEAAEAVAARGDGGIKEIASALKEANNTFHVGTTIQSSLKKQAFKKPVLELTDIINKSPRLLNDMRRTAVLQQSVGKRVGSVKEFVKSAISNFFKKTARPTKLNSLKFLVESGFALSDDNKKPVNDKVAFKNIQSHVASLANPDVLSDKLAKNLGPLLQSMPTMGFEAQQQIVRAVTFLNDKMPKHMDSGPARMLFPREYEPTSMEKAKFERYLQAVEQPLSVLAELEQGTVTREHIEAIKYVYPEIYRETQQAVMEQISEHPDLPYQKRLQLGILLDIPADESLTGESIIGLQQNFAPEQAQNQAQPGSVSGANGNVQAAAQANMDKMNMAGRSESGVQQLIGRKA